MRCSIIVCTKDRPHHLKECLESIFSSYSAYPYDELIIVDSSTDEETKIINQQNALKFKGKYIFEPGKGLSIARNTGIKNSSCDIIVFADDDFIVDRDWIKHLIANFSNLEVMCCTGRMLSYRYDSVSCIFEKSMSFDRGEKKRIFSGSDISIFKLLKTIRSVGNKQLYDLTPVPWAIGHGFCSFRKSIFESIGYFDEDLGVGTKALGGEEIDIFFRILDSQKTIVYEPRSIIYHNHRQSLEEALKAAYYAGASTRSFTKKYYHSDLYLLFCFLGDITMLILALLNATMSNDRLLKDMISQELRGLLRRCP